MITFKAIIISGNRRKDGTYPVVIRVTFRGKTRRLPTTLVCTANDLTRTLKIKSATILNKSDALIARMRDAVNDISPFDLESKDVDWVVHKIKTSLTRESFRLDFFEWSDTFLATKNPSTRRGYISAVNSLERFLGRRSIDINDISRGLILEYMDFVDGSNKMYYNRRTGKIEVSEGKEKIPRAGSTRYISLLGHLFNAAKDKYNDEDAGQILIPRSPFSKISKVYPASNGQDNLGVELMQKIISSQEDDPKVRTALDLFILSFTLMGVNMADLYKARPFKGNVWVYYRQKTTDRRADKAEMRVTIPEEVSPVLERLKGRGEWWLNVMHQYAPNKDQVTAKTNRHLKVWCIRNGVEVFTFYAARHTWATLARKQGVDKSTIDDCLAHIGSFKVTDIYAERAWDVMQEANRKVLQLFKW